MKNEDVSVEQNNGDEIIELDNEISNEIINKRNTTSNEKNEQLSEPARESNSTIEHNEANITLRISNCIRNRANYLKNYI